MKTQVRNRCQFTECELTESYVIIKMMPIDDIFKSGDYGIYIKVARSLYNGLESYVKDNF